MLCTAMHTRYAHYALCTHAQCTMHTRTALCSHTLCTAMHTHKHAMQAAKAAATRPVHKCPPPRRLSHSRLVLVNLSWQ
ncbi:hypothetical protein DUNSADRAFT_2445 [Dunaliella salina]|uniref:Secreted protein n=1 Tax=Dunaliella salina TaxID=3046 RepID=A0ABQ7FWA0_DUNSA|nr:hypothetical protein DUNSADRAFT_2445 [Dunaliella salina]|eukprot:KAF5826654.1 hypothetical protein DUNSADRAFT_2445 [Dunaliella salina]